MIKEPLYLNGKDVRITAVASTEQLPDDMPMELKKLYMFEAMMAQKPEGYCTCEMGYLIEAPSQWDPQRLLYCQFYVTFLEREAVINLIKPALDEGREVIIGDADNKEYTIPPSLYEKGFRRSKEDYYKEGGGWKNVTGEVQSRLAWADKRLFV